MKIIICFLCALLCFIQPVKAEEFPIEITGEYAVVVNLDENKVIYEKNADEKMYPASMTKIMTVYTALNHIHDLDEKITLNDEVFQGLAQANASVAGFYLNETVSIKDLLYGIMLPSGADACRAIAIHTAGSEEKFVEWMNEEVQSMGLKQTHFVNTSGLHEDEHYTTAKEMALILQKALQNPVFKKIYETNEYMTQPTAFHPNGMFFQSTSHRYAAESLIDDSMILGSKTGFTYEAGLCLSSVSNIHGVNLLMIVANAGVNRLIPAHLIDTVNTYDYLEKNYEERTMPMDIFATINVEYYGDVPVSLDEKVTSIVPVNADVNLQFEPKEIFKAPVKKDTLLGDAIVLVNGEEIKRIPIILKEEIPRNNKYYIKAKLSEYRFIIIILILGLFYGIKKFVQKNN